MSFSYLQLNSIASRVVTSCVIVTFFAFAELGCQFDTPELHHQTLQHDKKLENERNQNSAEEIFLVIVVKL